MFLAASKYPDHRAVGTASPISLSMALTGAVLLGPAKRLHHGFHVGDAADLVFDVGDDVAPDEERRRVAVEKHDRASLPLFGLGPVQAVYGDPLFIVHGYLFLGDVHGEGPRRNDTDMYKYFSQSSY